MSNNGIDSGVETEESNDNVNSGDFGLNSSNSNGPPPPPPPPPASPEYESSNDFTCMTLERENYHMNHYLTLANHLQREINSNIQESLEMDDFDQVDAETLEDSEEKDNDGIQQSSSPINGHFGFFPPPPAPPVTPIAINNCKAIIKFQFPENKTKLIYQFNTDPPAPGTFNFMSVQPFQSNPRLDYASTGIIEPSSSPHCLSLIPYEQREVHYKDRAFVKSSRRFFVKSHMTDWSVKKNYCEKRLRTAANHGNEIMVSHLLSKKINPNAADELGRTALHISACKGYVRVVGLLLSHGANPNQKDSIGNTPLHLAACTNHFEVVTLLLRGGTDITTLDNNGRNPLQLAQSKLKLLASTYIDSKIKVEIQNIIEMMLEYLQKKGHDEEAELLNTLASRLTLSTPQVDEDVKNLLNDLSSLSLAGRPPGAPATTSSVALVKPAPTMLTLSFPPKPQHQQSPKDSSPGSSSGHQPRRKFPSESELFKTGGIIKMKNSQARKK